MADLSQFSLDDLRALQAQIAPPTPSAAPSSAPANANPLAQFSIDDLLRMHTQMNASPQAAAPQRMEPVYDFNGAATGYEQPALAPNTVPYADQMRPMVRGMELAGDAASFGLLKRGAAANRALLDEGSYGENLARLQKHLDDARRDAPIASTAAEVAGGLGGGLGLIKNGITLAGRVGSGLVRRVLGYGAEGAAYGAAHGAGGTVSDNPQDYVDAAKQGAAVGGTIGAVLPVAGSVASAAYRGAKAVVGPSIEGAGRAASTFLRGAAQADAPGIASLSNDAAMLPDAGPSMLGLAQGAATGTGPGRSQLVNALRERDAGTGARLARGLDDNLGPAPVPSQIANDIRANQKALSPEYEKAFEGAQAVDTPRIAQQLDTMIADTRGPQQTALQSVRSMLDIPGATSPQPGGGGQWADYLRRPAQDPNARVLFSTRNALDGMLEEARNAVNPNSKVIGSLTDARALIDTELAAKVPGIKQADAKFAELARQNRALERGQEVFDTGRSAVIRPQELAQEIRQGGLPQGLQVGPSAGPLRLRQGARAEVDRIVGTQVNDLNALERTLATPQDWNSQKAGMIFGDARRDALVRLLQDERLMRNTYQRVDQGSQTAQRTAAANSMDAPAIPLDMSLVGLTARGATALARGLLNMSSAGTKDEIGRLLSSQGDKARALGQALLEYGQQVAANAQGIRGAVSNPALIGASSPADGRR